MLKFLWKGSAESDMDMEKIFALCLIGGFIFSLFLFLSAGRLLRFRLSFLPRVHLPRFLPRLHLPRLRLLRVPKISPKGVQAREGAAEVTVAPPWAMPLLFGVFITVFGASGLFFQIILNFSPFKSAVAAAVLGGGASALSVWALARFFTETATEVKGSRLLGTIGHVSVSIPEGGVGTIAYVVEGKRVTMPAKSRDGRPIEKGKSVVVVDIQGHTAIVEKF